MNAVTQTQWMTRTLELARCGRFSVSPNPMVGCLIVKNGEIIGQGYHQRAGEPHAEVFALQEAGERAKDAEVYLNLEPCCHQGRTPPCTQALIKAGIKKVYVACLDPNPLVAGKGIEALRAANIDVEPGLCQEEARQLNEIFFHYISKKRPFVIAKWAMSLDGKTCTAPEDSRQISGLKSQHHTHQLRQQVDAILVGARTIRQDNPELTVRLSAENNTALRQPLRIILSGRNQLPLDLKVFDPALPGKTLIVSSNKSDKSWYKSILSEKIELVILPKDKNAHIDLAALLDELAKREITSLLVEGGMRIHESFFNARLVNKIQVYVAPFFIGSGAKKQALELREFFQLDSDFHFIANSKEISHV